MGIRAIWRKGKLLIIGLLLIGNVMAKDKKLTFGGNRLSEDVLNRYKKVSKLYNIPLRGS